MSGNNTARVRRRRRETKINLGFQSGGYFPHNCQNKMQTNLHKRRFIKLYLVDNDEDETEGAGAREDSDLR